MRFEGVASLLKLGLAEQRLPLLLDLLAVLVDLLFEDASAHGDLFQAAVSGKVCVMVVHDLVA